MNLYCPHFEGKVFLNAGLKMIAIRKTFSTPAYFTDGASASAKPFFDHPAISVDVYSTTLYESYELGNPPKRFFYWLLKRADLDDLKMVTQDNRFNAMSIEFRNAIKQAMLKAKSGTRLGTRQAKVDIMKEAVIEGGIASTQVMDIIADYITEYTE